ncbi:MAG: FMN-dependent NADH-azoreductase [Nitrospirae bacterium]|nr:MAG: FMN-dependent NADH-azoreductase [Nitrospirota bacterium]
MKHCAITVFFRLRKKSRIIKQETGCAHRLYFIIAEKERAMAKLLYVEASPRKDRSVSIEVAGAFLDAYRQEHPSDEVDTIDLWNYQLPEFNGETINAKYAILMSKMHTAEQIQAWKPVEEVIARFTAADKYLFSIPMWNFGLPYRLKHYLDILVQPGYTFGYTPMEGYKGLVTGKPAAIVYARGGAYGAETGAQGYDFQMPYMNHILGFIGFTDIRPIVVEPMLMAEVHDKARIIKSAITEAKALARTF